MIIQADIWQDVKDKQYDRQQFKFIQTTGGKVYHYSKLNTGEVRLGQYTEIVKRLATESPACSNCGHSIREN